MKMLTLKDLASGQAQVGAQSPYCPPMPDDPEFETTGNTPCADGGFVQCDGILSSTATVNAASTATLTFDVSAGNFYKFQPYRFGLTAVDAAAVETDLIGGIRITAINFQGNSIDLGGAGIPGALFSPQSQQSLTGLRLPKLMNAGSDLTMTLSNVDTTTNATVSAFLQGKALRQVF